MTAIDKLKAFWNDRPVEFIALASIALTSLAKLIESVSSIQSKRAYAKRMTRKR